MSARLVEPVTRLCALKACGKPFETIHSTKTFCCGAHRTAAWMEANVVRRKPRVDTWKGPRCHCGRPGRYDGLCGNHNNERRREKQAWRKVLREMQAHLTVEEARECLRLRVAEKLISQETSA